jgi:hypothetical protein
MPERSNTDNYSYNVQWAKDGPYQTPLTTGEEYQYREWVRHVSSMVGHRLEPDDISYDMRGYWKEVVQTGEWQSEHFTKGAHFPDTYKTPYHPTFSRESRYALPTAPFWDTKERLIDPMTKKPTEGFIAETSR